MEKPNNPRPEITADPDNEFHNSEPHNPEIEQPAPSTASPDIPQEMPVREGY